MGIKKRSRPTEEDLVRFISGNSNPEENTIIQDWLNKDPVLLRHCQELGVAWEKTGILDAWESVDMPGQRRVFLKRIGVSSHIPLYWYAAVVSLMFVALGWILWPSGESESVVKLMAGDHREQFILPDQSVVWLNGGSKLLLAGPWPESRQAILEGEGFFEVKPDLSRPFRISAAGSMVTVLGTSFNLNSAGDVVELLLVEGQISFSNPADSVVLRPGQMLRFEKAAVQVRPAENYNVLAWKTGKLEFEQTKFQQVIRDLEKNFEVAIEYEPSKFENCTLTATFENQSLEDIMAEISFLLDLQVSHRNQLISIDGKGC